MAVARGVAGLLHGDVHQRPLDGPHRRRERREVGADVEAALRAVAESEIVSWVFLDNKKMIS